MRRLTTGVALLAAGLAGCADANTPNAPDDVAFARGDGFGNGASARYEVTVTNLTGGQPFTPPAIATHRPATRLFTVGQPASTGIQQIAENGNLDPLVMALGEDRHVADFGVAFGPTAPPLLPGQSTTIELATEQGAFSLSWASMLVCTNDGFTGSDRLPLPRRVGESVTRYTAAYDAGTEINTEDFADIVPPCPALTGVPSGEAGTGMSNPALAEGGVIHHHPGIAGIADLIPAVHDWMNPVAMVTVTRIE